jgi:hypothetical protein
VLGRGRGGDGDGGGGEDGGGGAGGGNKGVDEEGGVVGDERWEVGVRLGPGHGGQREVGAGAGRRRRHLVGWVWAAAATIHGWTDVSAFGV